MAVRTYAAYRRRVEEEDVRRGFAVEAIEDTHDGRHLLVERRDDEEVSLGLIDEGADVRAQLLDGRESFTSSPP